MTDKAFGKSDCWLFESVEHPPHVTSYKEVSERKETEDLKNLLTVAVKNGQYESKKHHDEKNKKFMQALYPNAKSKAYHWPWTFDYQQPGESHEVASRVFAESRVPDSKIKKGKAPSDLLSERWGEDAEELVFRMFRAMLQDQKIPSFLVHDYKWQTNSYAWQLDEIPKGYKFDKDKWEQMKTKGQFDFLISLPDKCLLSIEVKGRNIKSCRQTDVITEAFGQCKDALTFISILNNDLFYDKNIPFIMAAAVPHSTRNDLRQLPICDNCLKHIITEDELESVEKVCKWFNAVIKDFQSKQTSSDFNGDLHEKMIGRLFRPITIRNKTHKLITTFDSIKKHGNDEHVWSRWIQFNKKQADVTMSEHKLLWITGEPGSGKTLLFWKKIKDLLNNRKDKKVDGGTKNFKVIVLPGNKSDLLYDEYTQQLPQNSQEDNLVFIRFWEDEIRDKDEGGIKKTCNVLPQSIKNLQKKYPKGVLHIFIDEATFLLKGTNWSEFKEDWNKLDLKRLGFVWVIQNPLSTDGELGEKMPDELGEHSTGFKTVHLEFVMRMTKENVKFVSHVLDRSTLIPGHGTSGHPPVLYRMTCLCTPSKADVYCKECIHERQALLIVKILKDLKVSWEGTETDRISPSDIVIFMDDTSEFLSGIVLLAFSSKFPEKKYNTIKVTNSSDFRGCEKKVVIVDLLEPSLDVKNLMECLTRCVAWLILMDTGGLCEELLPDDDNESRQIMISTIEDENKYEDVRHKILSAASKGLVVIQDVERKHFDKEELEVIFNETSKSS